MNLSPVVSNIILYGPLNFTACLILFRVRGSGPASTLSKPEREDHNGGDHESPMDERRTECTI